MSDFAAPPPPPPPMDPPSMSAPPPPSAGPRLPWEERDQRGFVPALIDTVKLIATSPGDAFSRIRPDGDYINPLLFGAIIYWVGATFGAVWNLLFGQAITSMLGGLGGMEGMAGFGGGILGFIMTIVFAPVLFLITIFITAGIYHLCLMLLGGLENSSFGFEGTLKALAYAGVANLANVIPLMGGLIALVLYLVLIVIAFMGVHKTSQGKAILCALVPLILCCLCVVAMGAIFGASIAGLAASGG